MNQAINYPPRMPAFGRECAARRLTWWPEIGVGYYPVEEGVAPYGQAYFDRYAVQAQSDIGRRLMAARVEFVAQHWAGSLVDIGVGSGAFIAAAIESGRFSSVAGFDVNPAAKAWLEESGFWLDTNYQPVDAISLWDVLEHIPNFAKTLAYVDRWAFISIPIFRDGDHVLRSKHYRKDEHVWYFTRSGLIWTMKNLGFECVEVSDIETRIGREDIESFAFRRMV